MEIADLDYFFVLVDKEGRRRVPRKIAARDGRFGYAVHPLGKGNDASAADYIEDEKAMVQAVVLRGHGVRAVAEGGPHDGQSNTLALGGGSIAGYWLSPSRFEWIAGASIRPLNEPQSR